MSKHRYDVGETVTFSQRRANAPEMVYEIRGHLPSEGPDHRYRVRSSEEKHERIFVESQIQPVKAG